MTSRAAEFEVLHALSVKGMADTAHLTEMTGLPETTVQQAAEALAVSGATTFMAARQAWRVTVSGRSRHAAELCADLTSEGAVVLRDCHERFVPLDLRVKSLCTHWQVKDIGEAAVHTELASVHDALVPLGLRMAEVKARYLRYADRLTSARDRFDAGDGAALTGVLCDSYHEVWMELHQDLRLSLGTS